MPAAGLVVLRICDDPSRQCAQLTIQKQLRGLYAQVKYDGYATGPSLEEEVRIVDAAGKPVCTLVDPRPQPQAPTQTYVSYTIVGPPPPCVVAQGLCHEE